VKPTVSFHTLGCKLNFAETSTIGRQLVSAGFKKVEFDEGSDVVVINTCSVTENADKECRTIVKRALQKKSGSFVTIIGCYAQLKPEEISRIDGVDLILGATEKFNLENYLSDISKRNRTEIHSCTINEANIFHLAYSIGDRTRAFLKVQDGCDYPCTYCTIPLARGSSRSASIQEVVQQAEELAFKGISEIVLTGVNIGDYGIYEAGVGKHETNFLELIKRLDEVEAVERFRISSIEPNLLSDEIISFVATSKRFAPHFHIPLQSGSNKTLGNMRRRYRRELYANRVDAIKRQMPHACIGADVIVGFPGETEEDFLESYQYINELNISYLHVFTYSERPNTEAFSMSGVVNYSERKKRNKMLRILSEKKRNQFYQENTGKKFHVLFEEENKNNFMHGYTENYIRLKRTYDESLINIPIQIQIEQTDCLYQPDELTEIKA
jgi:threonylcarbamoyladenosine tRNA methylthiotransferase MtaB